MIMKRIRMMIIKRIIIKVKIMIKIGMKVKVKNKIYYYDSGASEY